MASLVATTWSSDFTLSANSTTPARWYRRTRSAGLSGSVPSYRARITCPATSSGLIVEAVSTAACTSCGVGPQGSACGVGLAELLGAEEGVFGVGSGCGEGE